MENLRWLQKKHQGENLEIIVGDIRLDKQKLLAAAAKVDVVYHFAAQVAVTFSVTDPYEDFTINALGTFNVLEAIRQSNNNPILIFSSTNKVYGGMEDIEIVERNNRHEYKDLPLGIPENRLLDFHSPYGCCYSKDTDILTRNGWKKFFELTPKDEILTYNLKRKIAQYQKPTDYFSYYYKGKMYEQTNRRLKTCVTPNHKMLVAWNRNHNELQKPHLLEAQSIAGKPMAYLLAADIEEGEDRRQFVLPEIKAKKNKHHFTALSIPMKDWLHFLGWYIAEGHCYENKKSGNCTVTLTTYYRTAEAMTVMRAIGLSPVKDKHLITATSKQLYKYLKTLGKSHEKYIPSDIKILSSKYLSILLKSLLNGDGNQQSKHSWRYTTISQCLANDVQEIAIKCGMASSMVLDKEGFYRVYISTTRTAQCNLEKNRSAWIDYKGKVYCVEVPNSTIMVRQNGHAYFYGNSKGAADQYVRDYSRIYGLRTVVFRQSCIYGKRQFGIEDQGWVAWFTIAASLDRPITIYGDGKQIRDVLFVDDLIQAFISATKMIDQTKGKIYNIGGGAENTMSLLELISYLEEMLGKKIAYTFSDWRPGDQPVYVSDIRKAKKEFGWEPTISVKEGVSKLAVWVSRNKSLFTKLKIV